VEQRPEPSDRHAWNSLENYRRIYEERVGNHYFIDKTKPFPDNFELFENKGELYVLLQGTIYCWNNIILDMTKLFETREVGAGRLQIRCIVYEYNVHFAGKHNILRYDNTHEGNLDYYHKHIFNPETGKEISVIELTRETFPLLHEVLDELAHKFEPGFPFSNQ
jgi:hypothetical protein